jgi:hypothetical protein
VTITFNLSEADIKTAIAAWVTQQQGVPTAAGGVSLTVNSGDRPGEVSSITATARADAKPITPQR